MLNSIKTLKRYSKATLSEFLLKKFFDDDKNVFLYDRFFVSVCKFYWLKCKVLKFPGFSMFPGKVATLYKRHLS